MIKFCILICEVLIQKFQSVALQFTLSFPFFFFPPILSLLLGLFPGTLFFFFLEATDVVIYLNTFIHLPLPELSFSPIHSPMRACISLSHYSCMSPRCTGAVSQAVQCQHAISIQAIHQLSTAAPFHI